MDLGKPSAPGARPTDSRIAHRRTDYGNFLAQSRSERVDSLPVDSRLLEQVASHSPGAHLRFAPFFWG